jgi:hypothetical protein
MGIKWTARLRVDFEMEDGASENLAQARLRTSVTRFQPIHRERGNRHGKFRQARLGQG